MAEKIICPLCGIVDSYWMKEVVEHMLIFDKSGECTGSTEDVGIRHGKPRCIKCNSLVRFEVH